MFKFTHLYQKNLQNFQKIIKEKQDQLLHLKADDEKIEALLHSEENEYRQKHQTASLRLVALQQKKTITIENEILLETNPVINFVAGSLRGLTGVRNNVLTSDPFVTEKIAINADIKEADNKWSFTRTRLQTMRNKLSNQCTALTTEIENLENTVKLINSYDALAEGIGELYDTYLKKDVAVVLLITQEGQITAKIDAMLNELVLLKQAVQRFKLELGHVNLKNSSCLDNINQFISSFSIVSLENAIVRFEPRINNKRASKPESTGQASNPEIPGIEIAIEQNEPFDNQENIAPVVIKKEDREQFCYWYEGELKNYLNEGKSQARGDFVNKLITELQNYSTSGNSEQLHQVLLERTKFPGLRLPPLLNRLVLDLDNMERGPLKHVVSDEKVSEVLSTIAGRNSKFVYFVRNLYSEVEKMPDHSLLSQHGKNILTVLADDLKKATDAFICDPQNSFDKQSMENFKAKFLCHLHTQDDELRKDRSTWDTFCMIAANLSAVLLTAGVALIIQLGVSKYATGHAQFFMQAPKTLRTVQELSDKVDRMEVPTLDVINRFEV